MRRGVVATLLCLVVSFGTFGRPLLSQELLPSFWEQQTPQAPDLSELKIVVVAGDNGVNVVKKKTAVQPIVEVRDKNDVPVAGAVVNFTSPSETPSVIFSNGSRIFSLVTDVSGRATVSGMRPVGAGMFHIQVTASVTSTGQGHAIATATITQTNFLTAAAAASAGEAAGAAAGTKAHKGLSTGALVAIVGAVGGGAVGALLALHGKSSSSGSNSSTSVSATIGLGSSAPTPGPPH